MWETWVQSLGWEDLLEKEMAIHSSIPAWRIPWMEEPDRLQSMGSQSRTWLTSLSLRHITILTQIHIWTRKEWHTYIFRCVCICVCVFIIVSLSTLTNSARFSSVIPSGMYPHSAFSYLKSVFLIRYMNLYCNDLFIYVREGNGTPLQYSWLENAMDGGAWWAALHGVAKSWTRLSDFTFTFHFQALEKEMATHSSVLAWRIPGTGEPGGLPSMGSHGVGHD